MLELGRASPDEMVLAFVRGEIDSPTYKDAYALALSARGLSRGSLIDRADLGDERASRERANVLGDVRGYGRNQALFTKFPDKVKWRRVSLSPSDFFKLKYINNGGWVELPGDRSVRLGVAVAKAFPAVRSILERIEAGHPIPDLILIDDLKGHLVVLEGNHRATAFLAAGAPKIETLLGSSPEMSRWAFI